MTYHDPDSGLDFPSFDAYREAREGPPEPVQPEPTVEELCAAGGHVIEPGASRCYCGELTDKETHDCDKERGER